MESLHLAFIGGLGAWEVVAIVFVVVLLFGAKKIPELARGVGRGIREFKDASSEIKKDIDESSKLEDSDKDKKKD